MSTGRRARLVISDDDNDDEEENEFQTTRNPPQFAFGAASAANIMPQGTSPRRPQCPAPARRQTNALSLASGRRPCRLPGRGKSQTKCRPPEKRFAYNYHYLGFYSRKNGSCRHARPHHRPRVVQSTAGAPYEFRATAREDHGKPLFGVAFNPFYARLPVPKHYVATVGSHRVSRACLSPRCLIDSSRARWRLPGLAAPPSYRIHFFLNLGG